MYIYIYVYLYIYIYVYIYETSSKEYWKFSAIKIYLRSANMNRSF